MKSKIIFNFTFITIKIVLRFVLKCIFSFILGKEENSGKFNEKIGQFVSCLATKFINKFHQI